MANDSTAALRSFLAEDVCLPNNIEELRDTYRAAAPFPHIVIDNLFSSALLERVLAEAPLLEPEQWMNIEQKDLEKIARMRSALEVGPAGSQLVSLLHSPAFLYLLSEITGIWQLLPDPYLQGGGHALMRRGGYFKIHADRNIAYDTGLKRRLAMIIFLNKDWPTEYGGQLELWDREGSRREVSIEPVFNRTALFEVAYPNYHGVPQPLDCPPDRMRHSFLVYYHTVPGSANDKVTAHTTMFAPQFYRRKQSVLHRLAKDIAPPFMVRAIRSLVR